MVDDQYGRLTFTDEIARAIRHLLDVAALRTGPTTSPATDRRPAGPTSRAAVFAARGRPAEAVRPISTDAYGAGKALAPRPRHSTLELTKITATGFRPAPVDQSLSRLPGGIWTEPSRPGRTARR